MSNSVELLKKIVASEKDVLENYKEVIRIVVHPDSRTVVNDIIESRKKIILSLEEIIERSKQCPAIDMKPEDMAKLKNMMNNLP